MIRVGLVGYGLGGAAFHAPIISATPGLELSAIVTRDPARREQARHRYPNVRLLDSADELWSSRSIDLAVITTPNRTHVPLALGAIAARIPVVVDKPLATNASDARELVAAAERRGVMLTVYQNRRWDGDFLTIKRLLAEGALGKVHRFESRFERWRPVLRDGWRESAAPEDAGGLLFDLGTHLIDQALVLFGPAKLAHAELATRRPGAKTDDDSFIALEHESGVQSHLWMSLVAAHEGPRFRVLGDKAAYVKWGMDVQEAALRAGKSPLQRGWGEESERSWGTLHVGDDRAPVRTERGSYVGFYAGVVAAIRDGAPPPVDPWDAVRVLEAIACGSDRARRP